VFITPVVTQMTPDRDLFGQIEKHMSSLFGGLYQRAQHTRCMFAPAVDVFDNGKEFVVQAELPGMRKDDIIIDIKNNMLFLHGELKQDDRFTAESVRYQERCYGSFTRTIPLAFDLRQDQIKAKFDHGILEINIPKKESSINSQIKIE